MKIRHNPLFQLPANQDLLLFLIKKQLEAARFMLDLQRVGFSRDIDCFDLGEVILPMFGHEEITDEVWEKYYGVLNAYAAKLDMFNEGTVDRLVLEFSLEFR